MTYIPARPIIADETLAYFASLTPPTKPHTERATRPAPADSALELMYGYYKAE